MLRVMVVGSAEQSGGGVSSVIKLIKKMPVWEEYNCYWLGTQIQRNYLWKLWYAVKAAIIAPFIMWRYDIVHFHTVPDRICLIVQMPELLCAKLYGKKVIMHIHMGNQLNDHTENGLFKWCLNRADRVVLLAKKWEGLFREKYSDITVPLSVVYNPQKTFDEPLSYDGREKTIIMAGYFDENKAPDILMKAIKKLRDEERKETDGWRVILMGNGDVEKYKQICTSLGLDDVVSFPGYVTGKQKDDIWRSASVLCLCSHVEGFPMVVLEAWNYGIPVISTPVGGLPDVIEEGKNCVIFDFDDVEGLAEKLLDLINDDDKRREMSEYQQQFVKEHFSLEKVNSDYETLYSTMTVSE